MRCRTVLLALCALLAVPAAADAALPSKKTLISAHQHGTAGNDWHVQAETGNRRDRIKVLVLYAQECGEATEVAQNVPINPDGTFSVDLPIGDKGSTGTWTVSGRFLDYGHIQGTWSITKDACTITDHPYDGYNGTRGPDGAHFALGNFFEYPPAGLLSKSYGARHLRAIWRRTLASYDRFSTPQKAAKLGYELSTKTGCPGLHHARKHGTVMWGKVFDPQNPQSIVYWCDSAGNWTLAGYMYRARGDVWPDTWDSMIEWHKHGGGPFSTWMTHVWMVNDPLSAWATCAPFKRFAAESRFTYEPFRLDAASDRPCSDSYASPEQQAQQNGEAGSYGTP